MAIEIGIYKKSSVNIDDVPIKISSFIVDFPSWHGAAWCFKLRVFCNMISKIMLNWADRNQPLGLNMAHDITIKLKISPSCSNKLTWFAVSACSLLNPLFGWLEVHHVETQLKYHMYIYIYSFMSHQVDCLITPCCCGINI